MRFLNQKSEWTETVGKGNESAKEKSSKSNSNLEDLNQKLNRYIYIYTQWLIFTFLFRWWAKFFSKPTELNRIRKKTMQFGSRAVATFFKTVFSPKYDFYQISSYWKVDYS